MVDNVVFFCIEVLQPPLCKNIDFWVAHGSAVIQDGCLWDHAHPTPPNVGGLQPAVDKPGFNPVSQRG